MLFKETPLRGAFVIDIERREDDRGFFGRAWCRDEFAAHDLDTALVQCNVSFNKMRGTLRGMHYQAEPFEETKLVRCTMGGIYDVILDLRPSSATYLQWTSVELTVDNRRMLYIPVGMAHGFQTLTDDTEVFYQMGEIYRGEYTRGVRWNDPQFSIRWPFDDPIMSVRDQQYVDFHQ